ncbi:hypothetical protein [Bifidobacterium sp.]|uniref:hypothetical protein n=1 Tax=unclassified Bifidobacterium TaxID=2608897 RepID=UPI002A91EB99|nr:hypothetical protein [Bifidobacterium sp.]MDY5367335.1 hypothetical protein [Bifidobacterium sp.]
MKKILSLIAAIAAVLGFGFAAATASADQYAPTINPNEISYDASTGTINVTVHSSGAVEQGYKYAYAQYDHTQVSDVKLVSDFDTVKYLGEVSSDDFKLALELTDSARKNAGTVKFKVYLSKEHLSTADLLKNINNEALVKVVPNSADANNNTFEVTIPAVGEITNNNSGTSATTAKTGASVAPIAFGVAVLAAAGFALAFARRRNN